jgi:hypothetical protein
MGNSPFSIGKFNFSQKSLVSAYQAGFYQGKIKPHGGIIMLSGSHKDYGNEPARPALRVLLADCRTGSETMTDLLLFHK